MQKGLVITYMETLFIADDESSIREGLKYIADWDSLGFRLCGEASNGEDALDKILTLNPNLEIGRASCRERVCMFV